MADATESAIAGSSGAPFSIVASTEV